MTLLRIQLSVNDDQYYYQIRVAYTIKGSSTYFSIKLTL